MGERLVRLRYTPPFDYLKHSLDNYEVPLKDNPEVASYLYNRVVAAEFVTTDSGTGVVHQAPAFGEVDFEVLRREQAQFVQDLGPQLFCPVGPDGKFTAERPSTRAAGSRTAIVTSRASCGIAGLLWHQEQYLHDYPFCWRADEDPLIQYPRQELVHQDVAVQRADARE